MGASLCISSCATVAEQFGRVQTISIWDNQAFARDEVTLSRHAEALSDAEGLLGASQTTLATAAFVWTQAPSTRATNDQFGRVSYRLTLQPGEAEGAFTERLNPTVYNRLLIQHARDRVRQIDTACLGYFRALDTVGSGSRFLRDAISILSDYAGILLGLSESATKPLAILAGSRAALDSTLTSAETLLLLTPAPMQTYLLVHTRQAQALAEARVGELQVYTEAAEFIESYAYLCTPLGIRQIIASTVAEEVRRSDPAVTTSAGQALLEQIAVVLNEGLKEKPYKTPTSAEAAYLAILLERWACNDDCLPVENLRQQTPEGLKSLLPTGERSALKLDDGKPDRLRQLLGALELVQPSFKTLKAQTVSALTPPTTAPVSTPPVQQETPAADAAAGGVATNEADLGTGTVVTNATASEEATGQAEGTASAQPQTDIGPSEEQTPVDAEEPQTDTPAAAEEPVG